jgi:hypothetical protein
MKSADIVGFEVHRATPWQPEIAMDANYSRPKFEAELSSSRKNRGELKGSQLLE